MIPDSVIKIISADYSDLKKLHKALNLLKRPQNIFKKKLIVKLTNGKKKVFQSFRIEHNDAAGPFLGGTIYSNNLLEEDLKKFSFIESLKSSISNVPFGGAFGGIEVDQNKTTAKDLERITKLYSLFLSSHIGPWKDIISTNKGTSKETQSWMMESYEKKKKFHSPATFVTNSHNLDGAPYILYEYLKTSNLMSRFRKLDIAIFGFGERGYTFASNLNPQNFRIVAVSDSTGGVVNSSGFDIQEIKKLKNKFTSLKEVSIMNNIEYISNEKLLELPVDILVIATDHKLKNELTSTIQSKLILELSNSEINKEIKGNTILPSLLLNSGFSVLNHLDWVQKMHGYKWSREEVSKKLQHSMIKTFTEVKNIVDEKKISYKEACLYLGVKRIIEATMARGRV